ncbi:MAG: ABC transporter permease [Psychromonas sp.]|nr:ABC transporter permease [Psychromonas sp.]
MMKLFKREFRALCCDPWQIALATYVPIFTLLFLWWIFSSAIPQNLPVAVVDYDNSQLSRQLIRYLNASPSIKVISFANTSDAQQAMKLGNVFALVTFPYKLKVDLIRKNQPTIDIRYNAQFLLVGKLLSSKISESLADKLHALSKIKQLLLGATIHQANININPIKHQLTALFNSNNNYIAFLSPPILIAFLQLVAGLSFINSINYEFKNNTTQTWYSLGVWKVLFVKITFYTAIMLLHGSFIYSLIYQVIGISNNGSIFTLLVALAIMLLAVWLIVLCLFFVLLNGTIVTSIFSAILAPAFAFMGITFPTQDMPKLIQYYRSIMPSSHYIDIHIKVVNYGINFVDMVLDLSSYAGFLVLVPIIVMLINKYFSSLKKQMACSEIIEAKI